MAPDVSVLLATFNGGKHVAEQLESLEAQSLRPLEIVVTDDGSTDDTLARVEAFQRTSETPMTIARGEGGLGASENFLRALPRCRGRYIAFCDQDDVWRPGKLAVSRARLAADRSLIAIHTATLTDAQLRPIGMMSQGISASKAKERGRLDPYLGSFSGWGNTMMFDARLTPLLLGPRPLQPRQTRALSHDTWTYVVAAALGRVSHIKEALVLYRQHESNVYGVKLESGSDRLESASQSPLDDYSARAAFYEQCSTAFAALCDHAVWEASGLADAAALYERRWRQVLLRRSIYTEPTRVGRLKRLVKYYGLSSPLVAFGEGRGPRRFASFAKDLLKGALASPPAVDRS